MHTIHTVRASGAKQPQERNGRSRNRNERTAAANNGGTSQRRNQNNELKPMRSSKLKRYESTTKNVRSSAKRRRKHKFRPVLPPLLGCLASH